MMPEGKRKRLTFYLAVAAVLTCYLAQVTDCYRLTKTQRREGQKEADAGKTIGLQDGRIVFGRAFEKGSQVADGTKKSSNASVEDESTYQADSAGRNVFNNHVLQGLLYSFTSSIGITMST